MLVNLMRSIILRSFSLIPNMGRFKGSILKKILLGIAKGCVRP